jgi:hypothetical protein
LTRIQPRARGGDEQFPTGIPACRIPLWFPSNPVNVKAAPPSPRLRWGAAIWLLAKKFACFLSGPVTPRALLASGSVTVAATADVTAAVTLPVSVDMIARIDLPISEFANQ